MEDLLTDIEKCVDGKMYYAALLSTLTLPDMAGRLEGLEGGVGLRYQTWFEANMAAYLESPYPFTGKDCYKFRCSLLHQGTTTDLNMDYKRIVFMEPGGQLIAHQSFWVAGRPGDERERVYVLMVDKFIRDMLAAVRRWLNRIQGTQPFEANYSMFARRHPDGVKPFVTGAAMFG